LQGEKERNVLHEAEIGRGLKKNEAAQLNREKVRNKERILLSERPTLSNTPTEKKTHKRS